MSDSEMVHAPGTLRFVVGEERGLQDVISEADATPLLRAALRAGARHVVLLNDKGAAVFACSSPSGTADSFSEITGPPLLLEGEPVGSVNLKGAADKEEHLRGIAAMLTAALNVMITANLKRMLTTEIHTTVVNESYEELLATNSRLAASETKYRELAESLETTVQERTAELKKAMAHLLQQEKLASVGQLAAGVAHELNNPMGFVTSNINTMKKYAGRLIEMIELCRELSASESIPPELAEEFNAKWGALKINRVIADFGEVVEESLAGAQRVKKIVSDLKKFSHIDDIGRAMADLNEEIERTLAVMVHEIPQDAEILTNYGVIPRIACEAGQICQAFVNIIINACQARAAGLRLQIRTHLEDDQVVVVFADNGPGIPVDIASRVFEPFFTTKEVGRGVGLGLTVANDIVRSHGGSLEVRASDEGGALLKMKLPVREQ